MLDLLVALTVAAAILFWVLRAVRGASKQSGDLAGLPSELRDARLVWSEKSFRSQGPVPLSVRIDRAYRLPGGDLVLVEFKRRARRRVFLSDVVELSAQRYVLQRAGHLVSRRAYVVLVPPGGRCYPAVATTLEDAPQVEHRVACLASLLESRTPPKGPRHPEVCAGCGHRGVCQRAEGQMDRRALE